MRLSAPRLFVLLPLFALAACQGTGSDLTDLDRAQVAQQRQRGFDVAHYRLDVELFPERRAIDGECSIRFIAVRDELESVEFDLEGLRVLAARDARGAELGFEQAEGAVRVTLASPLSAGEFHEVSIAYSGQPAKGIWFAGGGEVPTHVFTQGECEDSRWWFPCVDIPSERATHELTVTMPANWISVAAGARLDSVTRDGRRTDRWRNTDPHPAYLTTLAAGTFVQMDGEWNGIPLSWLAEERYQEWLEPSLAETDDALAFMSDLTGVPYPYEKYSQVCVENFPFGGMENISATTLTASCLLDHRGLMDRPATGLVVHEAAHQWFGNLMTCKEWSQIWLNEGFATYFTNVFFERANGEDDFRIRMRDAQDQYTAADRGSERRPIVHDVYKDPIDLFFGGHTYAGGATRLHLLRSVLGDEAFFAGVEHYTRVNRNQSVETTDLRDAFEEVSGVDLDWFFETWLESPGYPEFEVSWRYDEDAGQVLVTIDQVQAIGDGTLAAYRTPVNIEVTAGPLRPASASRDREDPRDVQAGLDALRQVRLDPQEAPRAQDARRVAAAGRRGRRRQRTSRRDSGARRRYSAGGDGGEAPRHRGDRRSGARRRERSRSRPRSRGLRRAAFGAGTRAADESRRGRRLRQVSLGGDANAGEARRVRAVGRLRALAVRGRLYVGHDGGRRRALPERRAEQGEGAVGPVGEAGVAARNVARRTR